MNSSLNSHIDGCSKIFFGGVSPYTTQDALQTYFEQFGELSDCVLMFDKQTGKSRCFGFVTFKEASVLDGLIKQKHVVDGKEIDCKRAVPNIGSHKSENPDINKGEKLSSMNSSLSSNIHGYSKMFFGGVSPDTTKDVLQTYFEQFGELSDFVLMSDKQTGKSRCFGFVTFKEASVLDEILNQKHVFDGKEIDCKRAVPHKPENQDINKSEKLFVGGLSASTTEEQFRNYFEQFGTVQDSVIMVDKATGKSRGFGFVTFDSTDPVDRVIERYSDNKIDGKWVECKRAQLKPAIITSVKTESKDDGNAGKYERED